jgi:hypothetical protein
MRKLSYILPGFYFEKKSNDVRTGNKDKNYTNLIGLLASGALAGISHKAKLDLSKLHEKTRAFNQAVKTKAFSQKTPLSQGIAAAKAYADGGQDLIKTKVLGMEIPYRGLHGNVLFEALKENKFNPVTTLDKYVKGSLLKNRYRTKLDKAFDIAGREKRNEPVGFLEKLRFRIDPNNNKKWQKTWDDAHVEPPAKYTLDHYRKFKTADREDLYKYNLYGDLYKHVSPEAEKIIKEYPSDKIAQALTDLQRRGMKEDALNARKYFRDLRNKYAGSSPLTSGGGNAQNYENAADVIIPNLNKATTFARNTSAGMGLLFGGKEIKDTLEKKSNVTEELPAVAGVAAGAMSLGSGVNDLVRPLRVGVSWSELARHGDGHKNPGQAMRDVLIDIKKENPQFADIDIVDAYRDSSNNYDKRSYRKKFDVFADAGMGPTSPWDWDKGDSPGQLRRDSRARVAPGGFVGYMTDVGTVGSPHFGYKLNIDGPLRRLAQKVGIKDNFITWGPEDILLRNLKQGGKEQDFNRQFNRINVSNRGMPTLTEKATSILQDSQTKTKTDVINEALRNPNLNDHQKQLLRNLGDKKLIFVTGSGRGDYVGSRIRELRRELRRAGLTDKYQIAGMLGKNHENNPISRSLKKDKNLLLFEKLPQDLYIGLPDIADFHDISTGTSGALEALSSKSVLGVQTNWSRLKDKEKRIFDRLKRLGVDIDPEFLDEHKMVKLDEWNSGNREFALRQQGVKAINSPRQLVNILERLNKDDYSAALRRGAGQLHANNYAKANMTKALLPVLSRQKRLKNLVGGVKGLAGLGLSAASLSSLFPTANKINDTKVSDGISKLMETLKR